MALAKNSEDITEISKWKKLEESGIKITLKRFIGDEEVVSRQELIALWNKSDKTIQRNVKDGMPTHEASNTRFQIFSLKQAERWRDGNIDKVFSAKTDKLVSIPQQEDREDLEFKTDMERKLKADADKAELEVKLSALKLATAEGLVVDANDLDRSMAELAIVHKTDKIQDENLLPVLLENKNAGEIKKLLQEHNKKRLEMLDKLVNKEFQSENTLYDIVEETLHQLKDGIEPESLIKRIKGSLI